MSTIIVIASLMAYLAYSCRNMKSTPKRHVYPWRGRDIAIDNAVSSITGKPRVR